MLKIKQLLATFSVVVAGLLPFAVAATTATPAQAQVLSCQQTFHARPTTTGWKSDPCASRDYTDEVFSDNSVRVQFFWDMTGGAHITDVRGTFTICNNGNAARVSADAVALHKRSDGSLFASSLQPQQVSSSCATMLTASKAVRGCGDQANPAGPNAYALYTEARGSARNTDDTLYPQPLTFDYFTTPSSYFIAVIAGAAC